jgi:hypothetical protein
MVLYKSSASHSLVQTVFLWRDSKMLLMVTSLIMDPLNSVSTNLKVLISNYIQWSSYVIRWHRSPRHVITCFTNYSKGIPPSSHPLNSFVLLNFGPGRMAKIIWHPSSFQDKLLVTWSSRGITQQNLVLSKRLSKTPFLPHVSISLYLTCFFRNLFPFQWNLIVSYTNHFCYSHHFQQDMYISSKKWFFSCLHF